MNHCRLRTPTTGSLSCCSLTRAARPSKCVGVISFARESRARGRPSRKHQFSGHAKANRPVPESQKSGDRSDSFSEHRWFARSGAAVTSQLDCGGSGRSILRERRGCRSKWAAARRYFGVSASALNREQAALLAGAIINPRLLSPARPTTRLLRRQRIILGRMGQVALPVPAAAKVEPSPDEAPASPAEPTGDDTVDEGAAEPEPSPLPEALPVPESLPPPPTDEPVPPA